jgi:repressor LexA
MMPVLTVRQGEVLRTIKTFIRDRGFAPSQRELCDLLGVTSTNSISEHLGKLTAKGVLKREAVSARAMTITAAGEAWLRANPLPPPAPPNPEAA